MPAHAVDWSLPVGVLAVGLAVGLVFVWRQFFGAPAAAGQRAPVSAVPHVLPLELRDLAGARDALVGQLRELDDTAAKRTPAQLARERYDLELRAARVLRDLEGHPAARAAAREAARTAKATPAAAPGGSTVKGFAWGLGVAVVLGGLFFFVDRAARPRSAGEEATGDIPQTGGSADGAAAGAAPDSAAPGPEEQGLRAALQRNPDDIDARIGLAQVLLGRQDMMGVWTETQYVLERQPGEPRALAYQALVRVAMGQAELAEGMLKEALKTRPDLLEGWVHLALVYKRLGRDADAEKVMATALQRFPQQRASLTSVFDQIRRGVRAQTESDAQPHAEAAQPHAAETSAPAASAAPAGDPGRRVAGTIELDPALAGQVPTGAALFITVREARVERGPPAAVKRLEVTTFPLRFELGDGDSMAGEPLPDPLRIEARIDGDGNAMTRDPNDPTALEDGVRRGATGLRLVLRRR
jgi:tetratricopeptide (TPR) repeat protein